VSTGDKVVLMACVSTAANYWQDVATRARQDRETVSFICATVAAVSCWLTLVFMAIEVLAGGGK
jgi:hypothetical protein